MIRKSKASIRKFRESRSAREQEEIDAIERVLKLQAPTNGAVNENVEDILLEEKFDLSSDKFQSLPLSTRTRGALQNGSFLELTDVQKVVLPHVLVGRDVLCAAKTGSGKTLCFIIPVIEKLYRQHWTEMDGAGALIIAPVRELAAQVFEVLRKVSARHRLSACLLIGGKDEREEQNYVNSMNILVSTPGRILYHLESTPGFNLDNLQMLVLDESDKILSLGFEKQINLILSHMPPNIQTILFSATQTNDVKRLSRLSLKNPEILSIHEDQPYATPTQLVQNYVVMDVGDKPNILWSFIKSHLMQKVMVFFATQRQARFFYQVIVSLQPGTSIYLIDGHMGQISRLEKFELFMKSKSGVLLCTDVASRGLDFKNLHWVIQFDCPADVETYIHRVGRTARYNLSGRATLFLLHSELEFYQKLIAVKVPISKTNLNVSKCIKIHSAIQALLIQKPDLKPSAQKAVKSYLKSVYLSEDKSVFDVEKIDVANLTASYGLLQIPKINFTKIKRIDKNSLLEKQRYDHMEKKLSIIEENQGSMGELFEKRSSGSKKTRNERLLSKKSFLFDERRNAINKDFVNPKFGSASDDEEDFLVEKPTEQSLSSKLDSIEEPICDGAKEPSKRSQIKAFKKIRINSAAPDVINYEYSDQEHSDNEESTSTLPYLKSIHESVKQTQVEDRKAHFKKLRERRRSSNLKRKLSEQQYQEMSSMRRAKIV